ncbi:hypothetical protein MRB53_010460 [Persea americana]|uniref:Uncharacterized protein n=1 Tax=Persea americana TaxID=3435 RepID=A0ACC2LSN9_PERAE|nr:hypothetical protein MRB53_010460 [Persea americana]
MGRLLAGRHRTHLCLANAVDAMHDLRRLSLDSQIPAPISSPPVVEDPIATRVRVLDNRFVESLHELKGIQSVAHKMKGDLMSTIGPLNDAGSLMRRAHLILTTKEGEDAAPVLSVDDSRKINAGITSVELDIPPLVGEDSGAVEYWKSVVYFNRRFKELSDMVSDLKVVLSGALDYEHVVHEFVGCSSEQLAKAFQELNDQVKEFRCLMVLIGESKNEDFKW